MDAALDLSRLDADRLIVALDRHVSEIELAEACRIVQQARHGRLALDERAAALARRCLSSERNAPELLHRLAR